ncbi:hypothetical protein GGX14DRAFT_395420 [Mycena pura]|uniref:Uncharacterized protein n=1 Tax=Mycena pura TaxID=153505 RepID=A0AAD6YGZ5_9AGAR|nr:hypothetical protein GGX14DRAFT_395420 [Mycena pura]
MCTSRNAAYYFQEFRDYLKKSFSVLQRQVPPSGPSIYSTKQPIASQKGNSVFQISQLEPQLEPQLCPNFASTWLKLRHKLDYGCHHHGDRAITALSATYLSHHPPLRQRMGWAVGQAAAVAAGSGVDGAGGGKAAAAGGGTGGGWRAVAARTSSGRRDTEQTIRPINT